MRVKWCQTNVGETRTLYQTRVFTWLNVVFLAQTDDNICLKHTMSNAVSSIWQNNNDSSFFTLINHFINIPWRRPNGQNHQSSLVTHTQTSLQQPLSVSIKATLSLHHKTRQRAEDSGTFSRRLASSPGSFTLNTVNIATRQLLFFA